MNHNIDNNNNDIITITIIDIETGQSELLSISQSTTTIQDIIEYTEALISSLQISYDLITKTYVQYVKDGKVLFTSLIVVENEALLMNDDHDTTTTTTTTTKTTKPTTTLQQLGIVDGDIIACIKKKSKQNNNNNNGGSSSSSKPTKSKMTNTTTTTNNTGITTSTISNTTTTTMELDFTNLLQQHQHNDTTTTNTNMNNTSMTTTTPSSSSTTTNMNNNSTNNNNNIDVIYTNEMNLQEIQYYNTHPKQIIYLLYNKEHLMKELNYYAPKLAIQLQTIKNSNQHNYMEDAVKVYRDYMVQQSIENAYKNTNKYHIQQNMELRYKNNPNDIEAHEYIKKQQQLKVIQEQYEYVMNEYPESLMLYIPMKINGYTINAFCDSGAQQTIMSKSCAIACQLDQYIDTRMAGIAVGVGTGIILGRIHIVQIQIMEQYFFPCSITVIDDTDTTSSNTDNNNMDMDNDDTEKSISSKSQPKRKQMPFLFGLDMMKRHLCCIDLQKHCLRFTSILVPKTKTNNNTIATNDTNTTTTTTSTTDINSNQQQPQEEEYVPLEVPFLHEKDLLPSQGGTKKE